VFGRLALSLAAKRFQRVRRQKLELFCRRFWRAGPGKELKAQPQGIQSQPQGNENPAQENEN
jgi:hypothetical protein